MREREKQRESEKEREREREREKEREREWERERETEYKNQAISRKRYVILRRLCLKWGTCSPHGESTSWNFPAKIKNSLRPIPSFDMMSKFPGSDHSCRRRYVAKLLAERRRKIIEKKNKEMTCSGLLLPVEYLRNGKRYSSSVFTFG